MSMQMRRDRTGLVIGAILVVLGVVFLVGQLSGFSLGRVTWPLFIIIPGLAFFVGMLLGGKGTASLAIPGSVITTIGLILFYQNFANHWQSWAYAWALIPCAVGVGTIIAGAYGGQPGMVRDGRRLVGVGLVMLLIGFVFFELVIGISDIGGPMPTSRRPSRTMPGWPPYAPAIMVPTPTAHGSSAQA
jgi:hypothetical protein